MTGSIFATIGYESADLADFIWTLRLAGVLRLIDVRQIAVSRRRGFAKTALSSALKEAGISYTHLKGLGDPKEGRDAARSGDLPRFRTIFKKHMSSEAAQTDLRTAANLIAEGGACLMCYERDHTTCHRSIVAEAIVCRVPVTIRHLEVRTGLARRNESSGRPTIGAQRT